MEIKLTLTPAQENLLRALQGGVTLTYFPYMGNLRPVPYFIREDTGAKCTTAARGLENKALIVGIRAAEGKCKSQRDDLEYRLTEAGRSWPSPNSAVMEYADRISEEYKPLWDALAQGPQPKEENAE